MRDWELELPSAGFMSKLPVKNIHKASRQVKAKYLPCTRYRGLLGCQSEHNFDVKF